MKLKADANQWHKWWAMRWTLATTAVTLAAGAWVVLPADLRPDVPEWGRWIVAAIGVALPTLAGLAQVVERGSKTDDTDEAGA